MTRLHRYYFWLFLSTLQTSKDKNLLKTGSFKTLKSHQNQGIDFNLLQSNDTMSISTWEYASQIQCVNVRNEAFLFVIEHLFACTGNFGLTFLIPSLCEKHSLLSRTDQNDPMFLVNFHGFYNCLFSLNPYFRKFAMSIKIAKNSSDVAWSFS